MEGSAFLRNVVAAFPYRIHKVLTDNGMTFVTAYNFAKHLRALQWNTPFQSICDVWKIDPSEFKIDPHKLEPHS
jgi:hypothetical protein